MTTNQQTKPLFSKAVRKGLAGLLQCIKAEDVIAQGSDTISAYQWLRNMQQWADSAEFAQLRQTRNQASKASKQKKSDFVVALESNNC